MPTPITHSLPLSLTGKDIAPPCSKDYGKDLVCRLLLEKKNNQRLAADDRRNCHANINRKMLNLDGKRGDGLRVFRTSYPPGLLRILLWDLWLNGPGLDDGRFSNPLVTHCGSGLGRVGNVTSLLRSFWQ